MEIPDDYLIFKNLTLNNCYKYCWYVNSKIIASGNECFCLNQLNSSIQIDKSNCLNDKIYDKHFSGFNKNYGIYEIEGKHSSLIYWQIFNLFFII